MTASTVARARTAAFEDGVASCRPILCQILISGNLGLAPVTFHHGLHRFARGVIDMQVSDSHTGAVSQRPMQGALRTRTEEGFSRALSEASNASAPSARR